MERAAATAWGGAGVPTSNMGSNTGSVDDIVPIAGRGRAEPPSAKSTNGVGLPGNLPFPPPSQKKGSFGGPAMNKSRFPAASDEVSSIQFGTMDYSTVQSVGSGTVARIEKSLPAVQISNVQSVAVGNNWIDQVDKGECQTVQPSSGTSRAEDVHSTASKNELQVDTVQQVRKTSSTPVWGQNRNAKDADRNKGRDPNPNPSFTPTLNEEDFPALGAPSSGKARMPLKLDVRREAGSAGGRRHEGDEQNNFKRGRDEGTNYRGGERRDPIDSLGRTLTRILRHQALDLKIKLRSDGYADVKELLKLPMKTGSDRPMSSHTVDDILQAVKQDNKQRFAIKKEDGVLLIRASQGHTIKTVETEHLLRPVFTAEEIPVCVHGTYRTSLASIAREGLKRMSRNHIHFARGLSAANGVISGMRKTSEILIYLDVRKALQDAMKLYISENGVILTEGFDGVVPPEYFKEVRTWPDLKLLTIKDSK